MKWDRALVAAAVLAACVFVPTALADSGNLQKHQSSQQLQSKLHNATFQGYGSPTQKAQVKAAVATKTKPKPPSSTPSQTSVAPLGATHTGGQLPFTGQDLGIVGGLAFLLLAAGVSMRLVARRRPDNGG